MFVYIPDVKFWRNVESKFQIYNFKRDVRNLKYSTFQYTSVEIYCLQFE